MPTFDGGHYFLTVLAPIGTQTIDDAGVFTSPVHALRERLAALPRAAQSPACSGGQSPFARNTRTHFARFAVIDDVAYNGREPQNTFLANVRHGNLPERQPQDHLNCPFLLFAAEFDAASGAASERDSYLALLWETMGEELSAVFAYCRAFKETVRDAQSFAQYIARCQIETTMSFNDYYAEKNPAELLPTWEGGGYKLPAAAGAALFAMGLVVLFFSAASGAILLVAGAGTLAITGGLAYFSLMAAGAKAFPAAPDSNLPAILKALHLQAAFARFAIDNQMAAVHANSADLLHAAFGDFLAKHEPDELGVKNDRPDPLYGHTQKPGVAGIP